MSDTRAEVNVKDGNKTIQEKKEKKSPRRKLEIKEVDCEQTFDSEKSSDNDIKSEEMDFQCHICLEYLPDVLSFKSHGAAHNKESQSPYKCEYCSKICSNRSGLRNHIRIHTGERPFSCDLCGNSFIQKQHLLTHMLTHSGEKPYSCHLCNMSFTTSGGLKKHIRTHTGERPYLCGICNRSFSQTDHLQGHMRKHTGEKPYKCDVCDRSFGQRGSLQAHFKTHTGGKEHVCKLCCQPFLHGDALIKHMKTHNGERSFVCGVCDKKFMTMSHLQRHIRCHTNEKPYWCKKCGKFFGDKQSLVQHRLLKICIINEFQNLGDYYCSNCGASFTRNSSLLRHKRRTKCREAFLNEKGINSIKVEETQDSLSDSEDCVEFNGYSDFISKQLQYQNKIIKNSSNGERDQNTSNGHENEIEIKKELEEIAKLENNLDPQMDSELVENDSELVKIQTEKIILNKLRAPEKRLEIETDSELTSNDNSSESEVVRQDSNHDNELICGKNNSHGKQLLEKILRNEGTYFQPQITSQN